MLVFCVVQAQEAIVQNGLLDLQVQNLILQESANAVDRIYAAEQEEVRNTEGSSYSTRVYAAVCV